MSFLKRMIAAFMPHQPVPMSNWEMKQALIGHAVAERQREIDTARGRDDWPDMISENEVALNKETKK